MLTKVFPRPFRTEDIGERIRKFIAPFEYNNPPVKIIIPIGFKSDGASIPRLAWSIIGSPWTGKYKYAVVIHDYLTATQTTTRREADRIFLDAMKVLNVSRWKRRVIWLAVRLFGWSTWRKHKKNRA